MNLDDIDKLYPDITIPLRARRVMVAVGNWAPATRARLYQTLCVHQLDPSESEIRYLVTYLVNRELLAETRVNNSKFLTLVPVTERSTRARRFDAGERIRLDDNE